MYIYPSVCVCSQLRECLAKNQNQTQHHCDSYVYNADRLKNTLNMNGQSMTETGTYKKKTHTRTKADGKKRAQKERRAKGQQNNTLRK